MKGRKLLSEAKDWDEKQVFEQLNLQINIKRSVIKNSHYFPCSFIIVDVIKIVIIFILLIGLCCLCFLFKCHNSMISRKGKLLI